MAVSVAESHDGRVLILPERSIDNLWIITLAAGTASRFGGPKLLEPFRGEAMVLQSLRAGQYVTPKRVILVTGDYRQDIESAAANLFDEAVHNEAFAGGMGTSIAAGVRHCRSRAAAVMLLLADQPLIDGPYLQKLIRCWQSTTADIVMSRYNGTAGPPAIFTKSTFDSLADLDGDNGARGIVNSGSFSVAFFEEEIDNPDIDTPADLGNIS